MKKIVTGLLAGLAILAQFAYAQGNIAVIDVQAAILSSEHAKERIAELRKEYAPEQQEIKDLGQDIQKLQAKMEQDSAVMSESERRSLTKEIEGKATDYQFEVQKLQKAQNDSQQELLAELSPKLELAIKSLIEEGVYSIILERQAAIFVDKKHDITKLVTEKLNLTP